MAGPPIFVAARERVDNATEIDHGRGSGIATVQPKYAYEHESVGIAPVLSLSFSAAESTARRRSMARSSERPASRAWRMEPETSRRQPTTAVGERSVIVSTEEGLAGTS